MVTRSYLVAAALAGVALCSLAVASAHAQGKTEMAAACPATPIEVTRSRGGTIANFGSVPNIPDLCRITRSGQTGDYYYGIWKSDWPGAGEAYPAIKSVMLGGFNARASFITRSVPGLQWIDTFVNEGGEPMDIDGRSYSTLRIMHERTGIEGNTYHSLITSWRDVKTGITLQTYEQQISGQSYGPDTTWRAVKIRPIPAGGIPSS